MCCPSGGSEGTDVNDDGTLEPGSFMLAMIELCDQLDKEFGIFPTERSLKFILILDGLASHRQVAVVDLCMKRGVELIILSANLTSAIQVHD